MAAILDFMVRMIFYHEIDTRNEFHALKFPELDVLYMPLLLKERKLCYNPFSKLISIIKAN